MADESDFLIDGAALDAALNTPLPAGTGTVRQALQMESEADARQVLATAIRAYHAFVAAKASGEPDWHALAKRVMEEDRELLKELGKR